MEGKNRPLHEIRETPSPSPHTEDRIKEYVRNLNLVWEGSEVRSEESGEWSGEWGVGSGE